MSPAKRILLGRYIRPALLFVDCLIFNLLFWVTLLIYPGFAAQIPKVWLLWIYVNVSLVPVLLFAARIQNHRFRVIVLDRVFLNSLFAVGIHALFFLSIIAFFDTVGMPTRMYVTYYVMLTVVEVGWSLLSRHLIKKYRRRGYNFARVAIVGANSTSGRLLKEMLADPGYGYRVLGFFDYSDPGEFEGRYLGNISELRDFVSKNKVEQIYYALPGNDKSMTEVVKIADDNVAEFFYVPKISPYVSRNFESESIGAVPIISVRHNPLKKNVNRWLKRGFDIAFSSVALIFYPLIYLPVAAAIKFTSPGPVYFKQQRTGYKGEPFVCLKFRSMAVNTEADSTQATKGDMRVTAIGEFLRRTSLDELPQFINVWKGDMSIVGPRPHMLRHTEEYSRLIDRYMVRHLIKPGITGWAQVNGFRGQTDKLWKMEKRVENDVWYIEHWTFTLDLKIIVRTFINIFKKDENAF